MQTQRMICGLDAGIFEFAARPEKAVPIEFNDTSVDREGRVNMIGGRYSLSFWVTDEIAAMINRRELAPFPRFLTNMIDTDSTEKRVIAAFDLLAPTNESSQ